MLSILKLKSLFKPHIKDDNYELSPLIYKVCLELFCHNKSLHKMFRTVLYLSILTLCLELLYLLRTQTNIPSKAQQELVAAYHLLGIVSGMCLLPIRDDLLKAENKAKSIQWSLKWFKPSVKIAVAKRGLLETLATALVFALTIPYMFFLRNLQKQSLTMEHIFGVHATPLAWFVSSIFETLITFSLGYFIIIIPLMHLYFTTEAEIQTLLLCEYVKQMAEEKWMVGRSAASNGRVFWSLRAIIARHVQLRQYYIENSKIVSSIGVKYVISVTIFTIFVIYSTTVDNKLNLVMYVVLIIFSETSITTLVSGQRYEDEWRRFYNEICDLPWYTWSIENRKVYYLLLIGSSRITKLVLFNTTAANYDFGLKLWKFLYSVLNAFYNVKRK